MSKILQFKDTNNTEDKKLDKSTIIWTSLIAIACIIAIIGGISSNKGNNANVQGNNIDSIGYIEGQDYSDSNITTYLYEHKVLHGEEIDQAVGNINEVLDYVKECNAYIRVQVGDYDYDYYIYNNSGECFAQTYDGVTCIVFRKDDYSSIAFSGDTGNILEGYNLDILGMVDNVLNLALSDSQEDIEGITVFDMILSGDDVSDTSHEYRIEVVGVDNFKQIYSGVDEDLGNDIVDTLKEQVAQVSENEYTPHVIYSILLDTSDKLLTINCDLVVDGVEITNWLLDGYNELGNWSLTDDWYTDDFTQLTTDESFDKLEILVGTIQSLINESFGVEETDEEDVIENSNEEVVDEEAEDINSITEDNEVADDQAFLED